MPSDKRLQEIGQWLRKHLTVEEAEAHYTEYERDTLALIGSTGGWMAYFRGELLERMESGDELWLYDSGPEAWAGLHGEKGMALVRDSLVVAFIMEARN